MMALGNDQWCLVLAASLNSWRQFGPTGLFAALNLNKFAGDECTGVCCGGNAA